MRSITAALFVSLAAVAGLVACSEEATAPSTTLPASMWADDVFATFEETQWQSACLITSGVTHKEAAMWLLETHAPSTKGQLTNDRVNALAVLLENRCSRFLP